MRCAHFTCHQCPDPRDAEIARLKAEVERLRKSEADLIQGIFDDGQRVGIEPADLSPTEVLTKMADDLAAHKRALAALVRRSLGQPAVGDEDILWRFLRLRGLGLHCRHTKRNPKVCITRTARADEVRT